MKLMLIHLSDAHIREGGTPLSGRVESIVGAVRSLEAELDAAALVLTGDIAYSGKDAEYLHAMDLVSDLSTKLGAALAFRTPSHPPIAIISVPGNHDCDVSGDQTARSILAQRVLASPNEIPSTSVLHSCITVQDNFFNFLASTETTPHRAAADQSIERLAYKYTLEADGQTVEFLCLNTAWLSTQHERQGELCLTSEAIPTPTPGPQLIIALMHHPYNWLQATSARGFRGRLEAIADIVLTGHEHDSDHRSVLVRGEQASTYIEGAALDDQMSSAFNVLVIDTVRRKQRFFVLELRESLYSVVNGSTFSEAGFGVDWEDFRSNAVRLRGDYEPTSEWSAFLDDPGVSLLHPHKDRLTLDDTFVFPDIREMKVPGRVAGPFVHGEQLVDIVERTPCLLVSGDNQSGKTTLAKVLFRHLREKGYVPVWLGPEDGAPKDARLQGLIERKFVKQYGDRNLAQFRQLDPARRVIILDDYDKIDATRQRRFEMINGIGRYAHRMIMFANDLALDIEKAAASAQGTGGELSLTHYRIQPFGHLRRNRLVERWLSIEGADRDTNEFSRRFEDITRLLDTIVGKNFVPAYPVYVLSILQASEAATQVDTRASTHGHFYEVFIKTALMRNRTRAEFDILMSFLSRLAWVMLEKRTASVSEQDYHLCREEYERAVAVRVSNSGSLDALVYSGVALREGGGMRFKYDYMRYYFSALFMRDRLNEPHVKERLEYLCHRLHVEEAANTLLFLAHLSKDPSVLGALLGTARTIFADQKPARMEDDLDFIRATREAQLAVVFAPRTLHEHREESARRRDTADAVLTETESIVPRRSWDSTPDNPIARAHMAMASIQILGQVLKNFPGSLEAHDKAELARECYDLGLRALASVHQTMKGNESALAREMCELIRMHSPSISEEDVRQRTGEAVTSLALLVCMGIVKRVSVAVGTPHLEATYAEVLGKTPSAAYKLIDAAIRLDQVGAFPEHDIKRLASEFARMPIPLWVLKSLVVENFSLFPAPYHIRQRACAILNIAYSEVGRGGPTLIQERPRLN